MENYQDKNIVIIGLGLTGMACIDFFITRGIMPRVMDTRISPKIINILPKNLEYHLGSLNEEWILKANLIIVSPSITLTIPILQKAIKNGIEIISEIELFCREAKSPIIAITGTNGKSTVTTLVGEMAKAAKLSVGIGGNIGLPALKLLNKKYQLYVIELSSFQLETTYSLKAIATILNITEDHTDRYPLGLKQYRNAKLRIYKNANICVINANDKLTFPIFNKKIHCVSFGINTSDYNLSCKKNNIWLKIYNKKILNTNKLKLFGYHNYINALAALALADAAKIPRIFSLKALSKFTGLPHRFQQVWEHNNIRWINDSKSTNISSTKAALNNLKIKGIIHLLLGGDRKSADFSSLIPYLTKNNIRIYCFGFDGPYLSKLVPKTTILTETLEQSIHIIISRVKPGDIVLLSPACASFDQFKNFEMRGDSFTYMAKEFSK
ncbi:UDP-N-acetylmuramoylalanine--D-glutamate ligase [Serratia symbiotica]|nr:UDP-N-acetylmuramoylalanine--D-glutamate ligase [Serratia symbiotica]